MQEAALTNPLGLLAAIIMLTLPAWLLYDFFRREKTFYNNYSIAERFINKNKKIIIPITVSLMLGNWIWNICKGL
nr:hypothetical protein [Flavobacterium akiainvivens]